ncbi:hypothetical protein D3C79_725330 [compost metagenome]
MHNEVGQPGAVVEQVRGPLCNALLTLGSAQNQVVVDLHIAGQRGVEMNVDQVHEGMTANGDNLAIKGGRNVRAAQ